jgi:hypothetical protein
MYTTFTHMRLMMGRQEENLGADLDTLKNARAKIEQLVDEHLRRVERGT